MLHYFVNDTKNKRYLGMKYNYLSHVNLNDWSGIGWGEGSEGLLTRQGKGLA